MSQNHHSDDDTPTVDTDALGAWVAETAAKKDVSERELLDEILSSYWVLEELSDVVLTGETDPDNGDRPATRRDAYTEPTRGAATGRDRYPPDSREQPPADEESIAAEEPSGDESPPTESTTDEQSAVDEALTADEEPETESESSTETGSADEDVELSEIEQELGKLRTVIDELATEGSLPTPETATAAGSKEPAPDTASTTDADEETDEFAELTATVTEPEPNSPGVVAELDDELVEIRERLSELEADLTGRIAEESDAREELKAWIEAEFDNIEDVLEHLLSTTDNLEYRLGSAIESHREQLKPLEAAQAEREQLRELKNEAIEKGVTTGECDSCGETVDLSLLPAPRCPSCDQGFTGVTDSSWWPFDSATLRTATTRRPQTDHSWDTPAEQQSQTAPSGSNQKDQSPPTSHTDHQPTPDTDAELRSDTETRPDESEPNWSDE